MTSKQQETKAKAQTYYPYCKESAIDYFIIAMGYELPAKPVTTWTQAISRFK